MRARALSSDEHQDERVLGAIICAATSSGWVIQHLIFTDKRIIAIPSSSLNEAAERGADIGSIGLMLAGADLSSLDFGLSVEGLGDLLQMRAWHKLKKKVAGMQTVSCEEGRLSDDVLKAATITIPYEKVKEVSIKKNWGAKDFKLNIRQDSFFAIGWLLPSSADEVKKLIQKTPLSQKLKQT